MTDKPGADNAPTPANEPPRHDTVSSEKLSNYEGLFRDQTADSSSATQAIPASAHESTMPQGGVVGTETPPAVPGAETPAKPRKKRRWLRLVALSLAIILAYFTSLITVFALSVNKIDAMPANQIPQTEGTNYLIVGSDGRGDITPQERKEYRLGDAEGQRTDTIMVLHVPTLGQPTLMSIPRDSWVPIPGHGENKINAAFAFGGSQLMIETVEQNTGLHIDNYVEVGMVGVARITDAIGGVQLCPDRNYNDKNSGLDVKKGCQEMGGKTALAYVRMRYADPKGDLGRVDRQQEYIKSTVGAVANPLTLFNPIKMYEVTNTAGNTLTVGTGTGIVDDTRLAVAMGMISAGWGTSTTVPTHKAPYWSGGQEALKWDEPATDQMFASLGAK